MAEIFQLIRAGDAAGVRALLAREPGAAADRDDEGVSALMHAAYRGAIGPTRERRANFIARTDRRWHGSGTAR